MELQSLIQYFYAIGGVPTKEVKLKELRHSKVFIQSTSQGSRCLKQGDKLLYLKEVNNAINLTVHVFIAIRYYHDHSPVQGIPSLWRKYRNGTIYIAMAAGKAIKYNNASN